MINSIVKQVMRIKKETLILDNDVMSEYFLIENSSTSTNYKPFKEGSLE